MSTRQRVTQYATIMLIALAVSATAVATEPAGQSQDGLPSQAELDRAAKSAGAAGYQVPAGTRLVAEVQPALPGYTIYQFMQSGGWRENAFVRRHADGTLWMISQQTVMRLLSAERAAAANPVERLPVMMETLSRGPHLSGQHCSSGWLTKLQSVRFQCRALVYHDVWTEVVVPTKGPARVLRNSGELLRHAHQLTSTIERANVTLADALSEYIMTVAYGDYVLGDGVARLASIEAPWRGLAVAYRDGGKVMMAIRDLKDAGRFLDGMRKHADASALIPTFFKAMVSGDPRLHSELTGCSDAKEVDGALTFTCRDQSYYGGFDVTLDATGNMQAFWIGTKSELAWRPVTSI